MNAERLHALIQKIQHEIDVTEVELRLTEVSGALEAVMDQPAAKQQARVGNAVLEFRSAMEKSTLGEWSPAWRELLEETGFADSLGAVLLSRIDTLLMRNEITPSIAKEEIDEILGRIEHLYKSNEALLDGFKTLNIGSDSLEPGECEVGVLIPRSAVENELGKLAAELKEIEYIVRTVQEVATGSAGPITVRTIASSDFMVFLGQHSAEAAMLAWMLERLIAGYKAILEIRKLHGELASKMGKEAIPEVQQFAEDSMTKTIKSIVSEALKRHPKTDSGRKNELRTALTGVLNMLADRIDRGFNLEIRMEPLPPQSSDEGKAAPVAGDAKEKHEHQKQIEEASKALEFTHRDGPPILHLEDKIKSGTGTKG